VTFSGARDIREHPVKFARHSQPVLISVQALYVHESALIPRNVILKHPQQTIAALL